MTAPPRSILVSPKDSCVDCSGDEMVVSAKVRVRGMGRVALFRRPRAETVVYVGMVSTSEAPILWWRGGVMNCKSNRAGKQYGMKAKWGRGEDVQSRDGKVRD